VPRLRLVHLALVLSFAAAAAVRGDTASTSLQSGSASTLPVEELVLDNGLRVLLVPRPGPGLVAAAWAVRRGSGDEPRGKSGVAHLLEHLLHNGSTNVTASDYARLYTEAGAVGIDARTDRDVTAYFLQLPPERLELWFWLESDRLLHPAFGAVDRELKVIAEERRQRLEATALGPLDEELQRLFWGDHPYALSAGGAAADLARLTRADAEAFFAEHYGAEEITAVLVGDFAAATVREMARRYFGRLPRSRAAAGGCEQHAVVRGSDRAVCASEHPREVPSRGKLGDERALDPPAPAGEDAGEHVERRAVGIARRDGRVEDARLRRTGAGAVDRSGGARRRRRRGGQGGRR
jgi:secreted Zn-dependent insulinase-like peptidase